MHNKLILLKLNFRIITFLYLLKQSGLMLFYKKYLELHFTLQKSFTNKINQYLINCYHEKFLQN